MTDREMMDQWLLVELGRKEVANFSGDSELDADCAIGFVYVDSMCGMTLNVDAWCMAESGSLRSISRPKDKQRVMLRYDCFAGKRNRLLTSSERDMLGMSGLPDWLQHYYGGEEATRALRALSLLDPVRAPGYPDDIKCLLYDNIGVKDGEWIWAKLVQQEADKLFVCRLLNEPFQDFGLHEGDLIRVAVKTHADGLVCVCIGKGD